MKNIEIATFGGGCFWCIEAIIQRLKGVEKVVSGYTGGKIINPTYEEICKGDTDHAEVIQVTFNTDSLSYVELLNVFMIYHNPTTLNYQGADYGTQYRSVIFYHNEKQKILAQEVIKKLNPVFENKIVTELAPLRDFYPAEIYHQNYYNKNKNKGYCQVVISPKIARLKKEYADKLKENI
ncbi:MULTISPECIES: peptide-methionine (S)-S-oxide reductase MsrA [Flavobacterium]|uniref:Peptide methionine sulfoxide reductase MsrA n=1 Tax=Flavobacterium covae TaxID=2906076 RepID=A0ABW8PEQ4_9FLAO|nr:MULTISPECIES: peptide-methionine (S)-S-oxide reductase MsrA [Flavobacterium]OXA75655.1 peptide-methionine (S)-S-oxide reductase [Flavobacterium columnare NBRC 100251 = ATCC 23463]AMA50617.1 peptide methionine sulfoxide reductase [Flavobacterium covae]AND65593.1 peptide-methionine (S)-S-oxide reductase [Flavobacterium covae]MCJ1805406.1 peptide-methionine (S)-S-oxide reductase MsrA [Flavobacterium covae]MCJ1809671.1 peptide-methionine (S)-S-oxide reductase MsrA [Flavobacterium covae]